MHAYKILCLLYRVLLRVCAYIWCDAGACAQYFVNPHALSFYAVKSVLDQRVLLSHSQNSVALQTRA